MADLVTLTAAKSHLRKTDTSEDTLITGYIANSQAWIEDYLGVVFTEAEVTQTFDAWGDYLSIFRRPLISVDSISYTDTGGGDADYLDFVLANAFYPARIYPTTTFPELGTNGTITVTLTAGYATGGIPANLIQAQLVLIAGMHEQRGGMPEDTIRAVKWLCNKTPGLA